MAADTPARLMFEHLRRRLRDRRADAAFSWLELREAGVIDLEAPWPFGEDSSPRSGESDQ